MNEERVFKWAIVVFIVGILLSFLYIDAQNEKEERETYAYAKQEYIYEELEALKEKEFSDIGNIGDCTQDCSGHEAGFEWAKENNLNDVLDCSGTTQSFVEGCETYVEQVNYIQDSPEEMDNFNEYVKDFYESQAGPDIGY